jgi:hypothetical protein
MTVKMLNRVLADTMVSPETGKTLRRDVRPFIVSYKGRTITVDMPGYYSDTGVGGPPMLATTWLSPTRRCRL